MYIIWAILAFSSLIIVHELGHFVMAKINGVKVIEFSIGMGPKLFSVEKNETKYSLGILPIGGYVQMLGDDEEERNQKGSLHNLSAIRKISVMIAGVVMNVLMSVVIFAAIVNHSGFQSTSLGLVQEGSPAMSSGLLVGDKIEKINGMSVLSTMDVVTELQMTEGKPVDLEVDRGGALLNIKVKPELDKKDGMYLIGVGFQNVTKPTILESLDQGVKESLSVIRGTVKSVKMLFTGKASFKKDVGGPVTIVRMTGEAAKMGIWPLLRLVAFLSINLAVINSLPFPALDGGRCLIYIFEMVTRLKMPVKVENAINIVGMILLMMLMLAVTVKDILFPINL